MDQSFNCLLVNNRNVKTISIFKDSDERKYILYDDQNDLKIYLNQLNVALLSNHIRGMYKIQEYMKLWKE